MCVVCAPSMHPIFITLRSEWASKYAGEQLGIIFECYTAETPELFETFKILGTNV